MTQITSDIYLTLCLKRMKNVPAPYLKNRINSKIFLFCRYQGRYRYLLGTVMYLRVKLIDGTCAGSGSGENFPNTFPTLHLISWVTIVNGIQQQKTA